MLGVLPESFLRDLRKERVQAGETRGFDQPFLVAHPVAALAHDSVGLFHDGRGHLPGRPRHVATPRVHACVVETE